MLTLVAVAVVTGLLVYVVPQIVGVFTQMHQALPWPTRALLALSAFVQDLGLAPADLHHRCLSPSVENIALRTEQVRYAWHEFVSSRCRSSENLVRSANTARCTRTLALLTASAVPLLDSLSIGAQVMPNLPMRASREKARR